MTPTTYDIVTALARFAESRSVGVDPHWRALADARVTELARALGLDASSPAAAEAALWNHRTR